MKIVCSKANLAKGSKYRIQGRSFQNYNAYSGMCPDRRNTLM